MIRSIAVSAERDQVLIPLPSRLVLLDRDVFVPEGGLLADEALHERGVEVVLLDDPDCIALMERFIREQPALWNEDIAVEED